MPVTTFEDTPYPEKGTRIVSVAFTDDDGDPVIPNAGTIKWTLTNKPVNKSTATTIINGREQVNISSDFTVKIVLKGNDLALQSGEKSNALVYRVLTVEYQYNSTVQNNLDDKAQFIFPVENMYYVT